MTVAAPVLLDTDIGTDVDDAVALALLLASPELDLRAVTTVSGDTALRARIAGRLLSLAGCAGVPVAAGVREPVLRQRSFVWLGHEGRGILGSGEPPPISAAHGVDLFIETVLRDRPQVVAIGPLSNLAVAMMKEPAVIAAIPRLTVMGGAFAAADDPAVTLPDYNLCSDPEAALVVLGAGVPTTLVPLDVTWRVRLVEADLTRLRAARSRVMRALCEAIEVWWPLHQAFAAGGSACPRDVVAFLHDPLTVAVAFDRSAVRMETRRLRPAIVDGIFRLLDDPGGSTFEVAVDVDADRFRRFLLERLESLP